LPFRHQSIDRSNLIFALPSSLLSSQQVASSKSKLIR
jgi:hypothetical protein